MMPRRLLLPAVALTLTTSIPLPLLTMAASAQDRAAAAQTIPNTGHEITPLAPKGADPNEYVFICDTSHGSPAQKQVIQMPNTYKGTVCAPTGTAFYVSGGVNDHVHIYGLKNGIWSEPGRAPGGAGPCAQPAINHRSF